MTPSSTDSVKHTPGPWFVDVHGNVMASGGLVAFPGISAGFDQAANARLIAAAPTTAELAMAFTFVVERFMRGDLPQGVKPVTEAEVAEALYELRNHVARATGAQS